MGGCVATAGRHSLLSLPRQLVNCNELRVPRSGTYIMKPTASCEAAQLWVRATPPPKYSSPKGDWCIPYDVEDDDSRSRFAEPRDGDECLSHSCAPSELAVGFWWIRVPSGHGAEWRFYYGGCVATAGRHSLLSLPRQLVNYSLFSWELRMESWELWYVW